MNPSTAGFVHILPTLPQHFLVIYIYRHMPWQIVGQGIMSLLSLVELSGKACFIFQQGNLLYVNGRINKDLRIFFFSLESGTLLYVC